MALGHTMAAAAQQLLAQLQQAAQATRAQAGGASLAQLATDPLASQPAWLRGLNPAPEAPVATVPQRSHFLFQESLPQNPRLPLSDYYRAQHMADVLWSHIGRYFPDRAEPTIDFQAPEEAGWPAGVYGQSNSRMFLTPQLPPPPLGTLAQPGVVALAPRVTHDLGNPIPGAAQVGLPPPSDKRFANPAFILAHEWAHQFQTPAVLKSRQLEGDANAFALNALPAALAALGYPGHPKTPGSDPGVPSLYALRGQFGL